MQCSIDAQGKNSLIKEKNTCVALNANCLKLIAILAMVADHCAIAFVPQSLVVYSLLRLIGRMTAPIMCFFIAEGYYHTSNLKKYMLRLLFFGLISHIPHNLCFGQDVLRIWEATDVMVSLLLGLVALAAWKCERLPSIVKMIIVGCCCFLSYSADWNYIAVLRILGFGIFHGNIRKQLLSFSVVSGIYLLQFFVYGSSYAFICRFGVLLVIPLLFLYNGKRGRNNPLIKHGFYWF